MSVEVEAEECVQSCVCDTHIIPHCDTMSLPLRFHACTSAGIVTRTVDEIEYGQVERIAQLVEPRRLQSSVSVDRTPQVLGVVGHDTHGATGKSGQGSVDADPIP